MLHRPQAQKLTNGMNVRTNERMNENSKSNEKKLNKDQRPKNEQNEIFIVA